MEFRNLRDITDNNDLATRLDRHSNNGITDEPIQEDTQDDMHDDVSGEDHQHGARADLMSEAKAQDLAAFFKALGDPTRVNILYLLNQREHCVIEIAERIGATVSGVSHQLRSLREARLVRSRREGKHVFYNLDDDHVRVLLHQGIEHVEHR